MSVLYYPFIFCKCMDYKYLSSYIIAFFFTLIVVSFKRNLILSSLSLLQSCLRNHCLLWCHKEMCYRSPSRNFRLHILSIVHLILIFVYGVKKGGIYLSISIYLHTHDIYIYIVIPPASFFFIDCQLFLPLNL